MCFFFLYLIHSSSYLVAKVDGTDFYFYFYKQELLFLFLFLLQENTHIGVKKASFPHVY